MAHSKNQVVFVEAGEGEAFALKGIRIDQLLPRKDCKQFSAYVVNMDPGQVKKASFHKKGEELYYVLSGSGRAELGENDYDLKPGCFFRVPPGTVHSFTTGEEPLSMLNFHSPPVFPDHDTHFID
ncbi:hypothetical protein UZ36_01545 [Candidatus Nitromaritima sp. SCGC AAA799-C22]|nr:hypothetical protein UZ36_01545 [Candidatus Nitromaritima sp. SCGC AAA799-C22]